MKKRPLFLSALVVFLLSACAGFQVKPDDMYTVKEEMRTKITDYTAMTELTDNDVDIAVDVSDTTMASSGTTKKRPFSLVKSTLKTYFDTLYTPGPNLSVDDTPANGDTTDAISSNWAYDHENAADPHTGYLTPAEMTTALGAAYDTEAELNILFGAKESATSNDFDPDRLLGDDEDDNLIKQDLYLGTLHRVWSAAPTGASLVVGACYTADNEAAGWDPATMDGTADYLVCWDGASWYVLRSIDGTPYFSAIASEIPFTDGATGGAYIILNEDSDNGSDSSKIKGADDAGTNPSFKFYGSAAGSEDFTITATANTWTATSSTGVTLFYFSGMQVAGGSLTPVIDDPDNFAANFTGANLYGGTFIANAAGTAALPDPAVGMNFTVVLEAAAAVILNPDSGGTADTIVMNGLAAAQDENITSSTLGAMCVFQYRAANSWMATCNGFVEATPP